MKQLNALMALMFTAIFALLISNLFELPPVQVFVAIFCLGLVMPRRSGVLSMAIQREVWKNDIIESLWKDNQFALRAVNADSFVLQGKIVHIPVAGTPSAVNKNVTSFPVTAVKRTDTEILYSLDTFYSTPRHVEQIEKYELSYDKRTSVMGEDRNALVQAAMEGLLYRWAPASANTIRTVGADDAAVLPGATGNRKKFTKASLGDVKRRLDAANISPNGRVALLTAEHYNDFLDSLSDNERTEVGRVANLATGVVGQYLGFTIMMRSSALRYRLVSGVLTPVDEQADGYAADAADCAASLIWHEGQVERALGDVDIFDNPRQAEYYGDIYSMILRLGGRIRRASGVWAVVEDVTA
jgi:hypothetical protein